MIFIASLVLLMIIKLRFPKGKSIHRVNKIKPNSGKRSPVRKTSSLAGKSEVFRKSEVFGFSDIN